MAVDSVTGSSSAGKPVTDAAGQPWPNPRYAWYVAAVLMLAYAFAFVDRIVLSVLVPAIKADLGLTETQIGLLGGFAFAVTYTVLGLPVGRMADRANRRNIILAGTTLWSLATAACGLATNFWHLFWARVMVGVGEATLQPSATSLVSDYFPPETRSRAIGLFVMGTSLGTGAAFLLVGLMLQLISGIKAEGGLEAWKAWELVFILVGLPGLIVSVLLFTVREPVRRERMKAQAGAVPGAGVPISEFVAFMKGHWMTYTAVIVGVMLVFLAVYGQLLFMPAFFVRVHQWTPQQIGTSFGIVALTCGVLSALSSGWIASWLAKSGRDDATIWICLLGAVGTCLPAAIAPLMPTGGWALAMFAISGLFANWPSVGALSAIGQVTPNEMRAQATAVYTFVVGLLSSGAGPLVVGLLTDRLFGDPMAVGKSISLTFAVCGVGATLLLLAGVGPFKTTARQAKALRA
ncbi:MAG TPA: MFS transporter [Azospirillaceae bacterium]|nr:MFS transporter [Azospirillaceae bacterium]